MEKIERYERKRYRYEIKDFTTKKEGKMALTKKYSTVKSAKS
jgi:hypothetical protein